MNLQYYNRQYYYRHTSSLKIKRKLSVHTPRSLHKTKKYQKHDWIFPTITDIFMTLGDSKYKNICVYIQSDSTFEKKVNIV